MGLWRNGEYLGLAGSVCYVHLAKMWIVAQEFKIRTCGGSQRFPENLAPLGSPSPPWILLRGGSLPPPDFMKADARAHRPTHRTELLNTTLCRGEPRSVPSQERTYRDTDSTRVLHFKENSLVIYHLTLEQIQPVGTCTGNIHYKETHTARYRGRPWAQSIHQNRYHCMLNKCLAAAESALHGQTSTPATSFQMPLWWPHQMLPLNSTTPPCHDIKMAGKWWNRVLFSSFW